jgi:hypothetical protein
MHVTNMLKLDSLFLTTPCILGVMNKLSFKWF